MTDQPTTSKEASNQGVMNTITSSDDDITRCNKHNRDTTLSYDSSSTNYKVTAKKTRKNRNHPNLYVLQWLHKCPLDCSVWFEDSLDSYLDTEFFAYPHCSHKPSMFPEFLCKFCDMTFGYGSNLHHHWLESHARPQYQCKLCGNKYFFKITLRRHIGRCHKVAAKPKNSDSDEVNVVDD